MGHRASTAFAVVLALMATLFARDRSSSPAPTARDDHKLLQGRWERQMAGSLSASETHNAAKAIKEIAGDKEKVTYQDKTGAVVYETVADFKLETSGRVKLYTFSNLKVAQGKSEESDHPQKDAISYIYRVEGDQYWEAHGLLTDSPAGSKPTVIVWKRVK
jgi:hypothetical protein